MTNAEILKAQCRMMHSACYVDDDVVELALSKIGRNPNDEGKADSEITRQAILIVLSWSETSRSEGGMSVSVDLAHLRISLARWCLMYGIEEEILGGLSTIEDGSNLW